MRMFDARHRNESLGMFTPEVAEVTLRRDRLLTHKPPSHLGDSRVPRGTYERILISTVVHSSKEK